MAYGVARVGNITNKKSATQLTKDLLLLELQQDEQLIFSCVLDILQEFKRTRNPIYPREVCKCSNLEHCHKHSVSVWQTLILKVKGSLMTDDEKLTNSQLFD